MGSRQRKVRRAGLTLATGVLALGFLAVAPAGAETTGDPRARRLPPRSGLHGSWISAQVTNSPYNVTNALCGDQVFVPHLTSLVTLYAYGADGGANGFDVGGGAGAVSIGAFAVPKDLKLIPVIGCQGGSAAPNTVAPSVGGLSSDRGRGGNGGRGAVNGANAGAGGGFSAWYRGPDLLVAAGGGGGAGGLAGGGAGGDAGHAGADAVGSTPLLGTGGQPGAFDTRGAPGAPAGNPGRDTAGGPGSKLYPVGGGGGGAGIHGGGGGGGGTEATKSGGGGGGGGSDALTSAGYWAEAGGAGNGLRSDGLAQLVEVRPIVRSPKFPGQNVVRGIAGNGARGGGYVVLADGEIRTFSQGVNPPLTAGGPSWPGEDMARGIAVLPDRSGGYVVDRQGQLHPFWIGDRPLPPIVTARVLWPGKDIARGVTILADGTGGYVQARDGRLYPFAIGSHPKPPEAQRVPTWPGKDMARGITAPFLDDHGVAGGWVSDSAGRLRPWGRLLGGRTPEAIGPPVAARGVASFDGGAGGVLIDGAGNISPFASPGLP